MDKKIATCEMQITLSFIGGKWKPLILYILIVEGTKRFGELKSFINHTSQKTLTTQLRELEADELILRTSYNTVPPKVEYSITEKGKTLYPIIDAMCTWGHQNSKGFSLINPLCK